jgi:hypothetical protein
MRKTSAVRIREGSRILLLGAGFAIGSTGCLGGHEPAEDEPSVGSSSESLEIEDECTATDVSWVNPDDESTACAGPWVHYKYASETSAHPLCPGPVGCSLDKSCPHWVAQPPATPSTSFNLMGLCEVDAEGIFQCSPPWDSAGQLCADFKVQQSNQVEMPADQEVTSATSSVGWTAQSGPIFTFVCSVTINFNKRVNGRHPSCGCETPIYPSCEHAIVVASPPVRVLTPPGTTKAQVRAAHDDSTPGQLSRTAIDPICSTGEDEPSLLLKIDRLLVNLLDPAIAPTGGPVFQEIVRRAKLSYELLDNAQVAHPESPHTDVLSLYEDYPDFEPVCGRRKPVTQEECAGDWRLRMCTRLTSAHVKVAPGRGDLVRHLYPECIEQLRELGDDVESAECSTDGDFVAASVDAQRRLHDKVLLRFGMALDPAPTASNVSRIADALHLLDGWHAQAARTLTRPYRLRAELDLAASKFWQVAHGYKPGTEETEWVADSPYAVLTETLALAEDEPPAAARQMVEDALQETDTRGLKLDREVLAAAYGEIGGQPVMVGAPLLHITRDALDSLTERLEALAQFHDVGCALANCVAFSTPTKLSRFWKVLAHLTAGPGSTPDLGDVLAATPGTMLGWKPAFAAVEAAQDRLLDAVAAEAEAEIENPGSGVKLAASVEHARNRTAAYEATGMFLPPVGDRLYTGVHANQRARVKDHMNDLNDRLAAEQISIDNRLVQLVSGLVQVREGETAVAQLEATKDRLATELDDLHGRATAFRAIIARGAAQSGVSVFEELMAEWSTIEGASDEAAYLRAGDSIDLFLTGQNATFESWQGATVADVGVQKIEVPARQAISISTEGVWAPSCALRRARVVDPDEIALGDVPAGQQIDSTGVVIGPEGYSIAWTGSAFKAETIARSVSTRFTAGAKFEACVGTPLSAMTGADTKLCLYADASISLDQATNWQDGTEGRTSAQFSSGLFLPTTPFQAATGSLVVVEMPPGQTDPDLIRDVHLVRGPHTTIVVNEPADLWVAVNDVSCANRDGNHQLHVKVSTFVPFGNAAEALLRRMAHTVSLIRERIPGLMARGEILPSESREIELDAKLDAIGGPAELQIAVDDYPAPMRDLFYKYLAREMTRLEAAVRVASIDREIVIKQGEYRAATLALQNSVMSGYLLSLLPRWSVRGLRFNELRSISAEYARDIHGFLAPLLRVWHPEVLEGLGNMTALMELTSVDVDTPILLLTQRLTEIGEEVARRVEDAELPYPSPQDTAPTFVALRFTDPAQLDPACAGSPSARCPRVGHSGTFRWATVAQSRALWSALGLPADGQAMRRLVFQPGPDDLYQLLAGTHYLSCTRSLPVVRKIGLALTGFAAAQLPPEQREAEWRIPAGAPMAFTDATGTHLFELSNPSWLHLANVPLIYATNDYNKVRTDFGALVQDVRGVSPFTTFVFDIPESTVVAWNLRGAKTIDLILELEAIRANDLVAVPICSTGS